MLTTEHIESERLKACNEFRQVTGINYTGKGFPRIPTSWDELGAIHNAYRVSQEYGNSHWTNHNPNLVRLEEDLLFNQQVDETRRYTQAMAERKRQHPESHATTTRLSAPIKGMTAPRSCFGGTAVVAETPASIIQRSMNKRYSNKSIATYLEILDVKPERRGTAWTAFSVSHFIKKHGLVEPKDGRISSNFMAELAAGAGE